jgi:hypothetical protein
VARSTADVVRVQHPRRRIWRSNGSLGARAARAAGGAALIAAALAPGAAGAQTVAGFALDRFEPAGAGSAWSTLESLDFEGHLAPTFRAGADWAWKPLVFYDPAGHEVAALVEQQAALDLDAAVTAWGRARFDLALPVPIVASGGDVQIRATSYGGPASVGVGDLRAGADVRLYGGPRDPWRAAAGAPLFLPTGGTRAFGSDGGVRFWPELMAAGDRAQLSWAARVGVHLRPTDKCGCDLAPGSELTWGAAAGWWASPRLLLGAELTGAKALTSGGPFTQATLPLELLASGRVTVAPRWRASLAAGPGLTNGAGSPALRVVLGVEYALSPWTSRDAANPPNP